MVGRVHEMIFLGTLREHPFAIWRSVASDVPLGVGVEHDANPGWAVCAGRLPSTSSDGDQIARQVPEKIGA